jgi:hypothetical protein
MPAPQNWDAPAGIALYGKIKPGDRLLQLLTKKRRRFL